jgi:hypothetical protein
MRNAPKRMVDLWGDALCGDPDPWLSAMSIENRR